IESPFRALQRAQHTQHPASANEREIATRLQALRPDPLVKKPTHVIPETLGIAADFFQAIKVLPLAGPKRLATDRTMDRYERSVTNGPSGFRVVQDRQPQFPSVRIRQE